MTAIGRFEGRGFKPTGKGGGSKKGKPQGRWPMVCLVMADAVIERAKGSSESWNTDRSYRMTKSQFEAAILQIVPDFGNFITSMMPNRVTPWPELLLNRVYKMYYSGTSARGKNHDPKTRAVQSKEHWRNRVPVGDPLHKLRNDIISGRIQSIIITEYL